MPRTVQFFFEFASPYSYLASIDVDQRVEAAGGIVEWLPVDLPRLWKAQGVLEPYMAIRTVKMPYIRHDATRCAQAMGVPMRSPGTPAIDTSLAKHTYWGLREAGDDRAKPFLQHVWHRYFGEGQAIATLDDIAAAAAPLALSIDEIAALAALPASIAAQEASNAAAIASGCFGVPWFVTGDTQFFGHDRIDHLTRWLNEQPELLLSQGI